MENNEITEVIFCECFSPDHQIIIKSISYTEAELEIYHEKMREETRNEIFVNIHLSPKPFWERVKYAWKYIWGYKSRYGAWDEVITTRSRIKDLANKL